jgi:YfiH family protein
MRPRLGEGRSRGLTWFEVTDDDVRVVFPTRAGGVSTGAYRSLNLGLSVGDQPAAVLENRARLCVAAGVKAIDLVVPGQVHGTRITEVGEPHRGRGATDRSAVIGQSDGLLTRTRSLPLAISYADCVPVLVVGYGETGEPAIALVHAGWRGTLAGIASEAARRLAATCALAWAAIGPSIGPCCFTVSASVAEQFGACWPNAVSGEAVDLRACVTEQLTDAGLDPAAVVDLGVCTSCDGRFYSHRRDRGLTGRHLAIAWSRGRGSGDGEEGGA